MFLSRFIGVFLAVWFAAQGTQAAFDSKAFNQTQGPLQIQRVTPDGKDVPAGRQLVFQFNRPVVPVGRMERSAAEVNVTIMPALNCQWRWLDTSALACQLDEASAMKPATRYRVLMQPGIRAEDGATLAAPFSSTFITERPVVTDVDFKTWKHPGMPVLRVSFNQPISRASVEKSLRIMPYKKPQVPLSVFPDQDDAAQPVPEYHDAWLVSPQTLLPLDSNVELKVTPGLLTNLGPEPGIEDRVAIKFDTFPEFRFLGVRCRTNADQELITRPGKKTDGRCNPLRSVELLFSTPVSVEQVKAHLTLTPDLAGGRQDYDPWQGAYDYNSLSRPHTKGDLYEVNFPEFLKAYKNYTVKIAASTLKDKFGRVLKTPVQLAFQTDHRVPDYTFEYDVAVLEQGVDSEVPIYTTNLDALNLNYTRVTSTGVWANQTWEQKLAKFPDLSVKRPFGVRAMLPGNASGAVFGSLDTTPDIGQEWRKNWFFAQVTPFHVQVKAGHFNTLVWVTSLATGQPVEGVDVQAFLTSLNGFDPAAMAAAAPVKTDADGLAILSGTKDLDPELKHQYVYAKDEPRLWVRCAKGADLALLPLDNEFSVNMYELSETYLNDNAQRQYGHIHTWGTTAQGIYKAGDTVQFKLLVRDQDNRRFVPAPKEGYTLVVKDPMDKVVHEVQNFSLSEFGGYAGEFAIAKNAAVGWYYFELSANFYPENTWSPLRVLVSDFTPATFKVATTLNGERFQTGQEMRIDTAAALHAGGPYANAHAQVFVRLDEEPFESAHPQAHGFQFDTLVPDYYGDNMIHQQEGEVNANGNLQTVFNLPDSPVLYGKLSVESTVRDDRGKDVAGRAQAKYIGRDRFVGVKQDQWVLAANQPAAIQLLVVDEMGAPVTNWPVQVKVERRETKAARVKGAGNAYLTEYTNEWVPLSSCEVKSLAGPQTCAFTPNHAGLLRITANIADTKGRAQATEWQQWVSGKGEVVWENPPGNGTQLIPEKKSYQVGDTARYLFKNPFPGAQALITVERYGVLKSWRKQLHNSVEIIEIPVEPDYIPGFYVAVSVISPRVDKPLPEEGQVDLGKPAFRMGYAQTEVTDPYKEIAIAIQPDKQKYRPRDTVTVNLQATPRKPFADGKAEPIELAVAVLDEAVFSALHQGRDAFDPYKGFYTLDGLDIRNYNLLVNLIGRQKFEKKGANPGGDGGGGLDMRSLFKFVSYWNPSQQTDAQGRAWIRFQVPDNLTGWRVLAMAVTPSDRMGLGDARFAVNQPIELQPVLPNQVSSGDQFTAGFSVMNRRAQPVDITVQVSASGPLQLLPGQAVQTVTQTLPVQPYQRALVWLPLATTAAGDIQFTVQASGNGERDGLKHTLPVRKRRALETAATYGTTEQAEITESLLFPKDIHGDTGGVSIVASPTVITGVDGAFEYMRDYPYACWEQKLSKGVMASHYTQLQSWINLPWEGARELAPRTLALAQEYQAPNGGMAYFTPTDERVDPYLSAYTALAFHWLRAAGHTIPAQAEEKLHGYLLEILRKNVMPNFYSKGMASSMRAVALAALARAGKATAADLNRYEPHLPEMSLFGRAQFLDAALSIANTGALRDKVAKDILARGNQSGGKFTFTETLDDGYSRVLASPLRDTCAILSVLTRYGETPEGAKTAGDVPFKLARSLVAQRQGKDNWGNTQENLFCMNALIDFARVYEKDTPNMTVRAWLDQENLGEAKFSARQDPPHTFEHAMQPADPGRQATVKVQKDGVGRVYYGVRMRYATLADKATAINAGMDLRREYHVERNGKWELLQSPMALATGELVRVDLYLSLPAARSFVVVDDPVPGGLEPVNRDLATASTVAADKAQGRYAGGSAWFQFQDWKEYSVDFWSFYHQELRHHAAVFYSEWLAPGNYHLSYTAQAIAPGEFAVAAPHAEEMYEPDVYGTGISAKLTVTRAAQGKP